jgi:acyl carrier protein
MEALFIEKFKDTLDYYDQEIKLTDEFRNYKEWNSLVFLSLIAMIDEEFDVIIEGADFKKLKTVGDIINAIKERKEV